MRSIDVRNFTLGAESHLNHDELLASLQQLKRNGQWFLLQDLADTALDKYPDSLQFRHLRALALVNVGAVNQAAELIKRQTEQILRRPEKLLETWKSLRSLVTFDDDEPNDASLQALSDVNEGFTTIEQTLMPERHVLEELVGLRGRIHKELWRRGNSDELKECLRCYRIGYEMTRGHFTGINYATMARLNQQEDVSDEIAKEVVRRCKQEKQPDYWTFATLGEANLLLGKPGSAIKAFTKAFALEPSAHQHDSTRRQLLMHKQHGIRVPDEVLELYAAPNIVVFTGHMIDRPNRELARFPAEIEPAIFSEIRNALEVVSANVGYSSAACGGDLLFIEAMLDRGAEVNVVLPFNNPDFIESSVRFAGENWVRRFENALRLANSVTYVTDDAYLGHDCLFEGCNRIVIGKAAQRARYLESELHLLTVLDQSSELLVGGTKFVNAVWPNTDKLTVIDPAKFRDTVPLRSSQHICNAETSNQSETNEAADQQSNDEPQRQLRAMMFADVKDYSQLSDADGPPFIHFFKIVCDEVKTALKSESIAEPELVRTAGDGLFVVMNSAESLAKYAVAVKNAVRVANAAQENAVLRELEMRIALHAAPVYVFDNPFNPLKAYYGSHVNRAARLEPITVPGEIYATEQFVAMWTTEQIERTKRLRLDGSWHWELVGELELAKNAGAQRTFHLRDS